MVADAASASDATKDPFADARTNLRDTVKWLAATFAALAAVVVGSGPLSGLGALEIANTRFWVAVVTLLIGFLCICGALYETLRILLSEAVYRSDLLGQTGAAESTRINRELSNVRKTIDDRARDLLPGNYENLAELADKSRLVDTQLKPGVITDEIIRSKWLRSRKLIDDVLIGLLPFALYLRLQQRLTRSIPLLFFLGVVALISLAIYGIAVHSDPSKETGRTVVVINDTNRPDKVQVAELPTLESVLFSTGKAVVTVDGVKAVQAARDAMRGHRDAVLLVRAHTDTVGGPKVNESLAHQRAQAVLALLKETGGISASRIYVAELATLDTEVVTQQKQPSAPNRSVELRLVALKNAK